ncbi:MAG: hypothetical protein H5U08_04625 [Thermogutta sp.]|uniref:hypothetical protein n=1 Tax=Thermogutta sp. TaxID=1962930 RepID=UPI001986F56B|nr:hypothetical protein [Thermogutta sp.]MBC7351624.1 hypothetical protein [Thermogutta sp.]
MSIIPKVAMIILVSAAVGFMLGFVQITSVADPTRAQPPFANSVEQRIEMIAELRRIRELLTRQNELMSQQNSLLKEQNELLRKMAVSHQVPADDQNTSTQSTQ